MKRTQTPRAAAAVCALGAAIALVLFVAPPQAFAAAPDVGTAFRSVRISGKKLGTDYTPSGASLEYTVAYDSVSGLYHLWCFTGASGVAKMTEILHATSPDGVTFTPTGTMSYASAPDFAGFGATGEPDYQFPRVVNFGGSWKLLLWTPNAQSGNPYGSYNYNESMNDLGASANQLAVTHQGPVTGGTFGQTTGWWGLLGGDLFTQYDNAGGVGRFAFTDGTPPTVPALPDATQDLITGTGYVYGLSDPSNPLAVYPHNSARVIDLGTRLGTFYSLRHWSDGSRVNKQIYYVESVDGGATWSAVAGLFADGSAVTIDGAPNAGNFSLPEVVIGAAGPVFYFSTTDGDGHVVIGTNASPADLAPAALAVDVDTAAGGSSDLNGVFEPGETVSVEPSWKNVGAAPVAAGGAASAFDGPSGPAYGIGDALADYGIVGAGATRSCADGADCYTMSVSAPASRPAGHWDATFVETLSTATAPKTWTIHIGDSFGDVPRSELFYKGIETIFHHGITLGCTATSYCPADDVPRSQMAMFIARGLTGGSPLPASGLVNGQPYNCVSGGVSLFTDVKPTDIFCRGVHSIAAQNVTSGCAPGLYCPGRSITRSEMAIFIAKAIVAPAGGAGVPETYGPDPVTGLSYSCSAALPNLHFTDVQVTDPFCKHAHFLWATGVVDGCSADQYCPSLDTARDEMSKFLTNAFQLLLYGP